MPLLTQCPECRASFRLPDDMVGKRVRCTGCQAVFTVRDMAAPIEDEVEAVPVPPRSKEPLLSDLVSKRLAQEKERARRAERRPDRDREPDEDEPQGGLPLGLILGGAAALVTLVLVAALIVFLSGRSPSDAGPVARKQNGPPVPPREMAIQKDLPGERNPPRIDPLEVPPTDIRPPVIQPPEVERAPVEPPPEPDDPRRNAIPKPLEPIQTGQLAAPRVEAPLPGPVTDVRVGGAGRFLVLQMDSVRQLAIFDANVARVVKLLPLNEVPCLMAAGLDSIVVASPIARKLERWSLITFERELTETLSSPIQALALGSASRGPLVLCGRQTQFIDLDTLQEMQVVLNSKSPGNRRLAPHFLNASADGRVFTCRDGVGGEPHTLFSLVLDGRRGTIRAESQPESMFLPSPDGRVLYAESGIYSEELVLTHPEKPINQIVNPFLPATQGGYFLRIQGNRGSGLGELSFFLPGTTTPIAKLSSIEGYIGAPIAYGHAPDRLMHDKRIHYIAEARLLVTVPKSNDRLVLRSFDIEAEMAKADLDYLFVSGRVNDIAVRGQEYREQLVIQSKKGGVKCKLSLGPPGMTVSETGEIRWMVPGDLAEREARATVSLTDAGGRETVQAVRLSIRGDKR